jgi:hypothetical protein
MGSARTFWCRWRRRLKVCFSPACQLSGWPELSFVDRFFVVWRLFSAWRAGVLSSCFAKKKVAKEEGDPRVGARCAGPLRYSKPAGAAELGPAGLKQSSPFIRRFLRCSAPLMGTPEASRNDGSAQEKELAKSTAVKPEKCQGRALPVRRRRFSGPLGRCRATQV